MKIHYDLYKFGEKKHKIVSAKQHYRAYIIISMTILK